MCRESGKTKMSVKLYPWGYRQLEYGDKIQRDSTGGKRHEKQTKQNMNVIKSDSIASSLIG